MKNKHTEQFFPEGINFPSELKYLSDYIIENGYTFSADFRLSEYSNIVKTYFDEGERLEKYIIDFASSSDGGIYAVWNYEAQQKIVFLGSEGTDWYVLAESMLDFIQLLAIGYSDFILEDLRLPPVGNPPKVFKNWVEQMFNLKVPHTAEKICNKKDEQFTRWLYKTLNPKDTFEEFNPSSSFNQQFQSIEYRLVINSLSKDKIKFIGDLRKVSKMSISELLKITEFPTIVYQNKCYFRGRLSIENFPNKDKDVLIYLIENYRDELEFEYRNNIEQSKLTEFQKFPL